MLGELGALSDRLIVMSATAKRFAVEHYGIPEHKLVIVPHGIPDLPFVDPNYYKDRFGVEGKKVILTFGLLSPNKGIEVVVRGLPRILRSHPEAVFLVVGATHPHVRATQGEAYRLGVQKLARRLNVDDHVVFHDRYVELSELCEVLGAADVYVTPYLDEEQIVSGTLSYAMGAGKAVVSTPYWHAREALAEGRGLLVGFGDHEALADAVVRLFTDEVERHAIRKRAYAATREWVWSRVGQSYLEVMTEARTARLARPRPLRAPALGERRHPASLPEIDLRHLLRLTDGTGILQHAKSFVPDRAHGYCTDDNARALLVLIGARPHLADPVPTDELVIRYLAFLQHAFDPASGCIRNFLAYDRR